MIYFFSVYSLEAFDQIQRSFLKDIGVDELSAFISFNLTPLSLRRDIAMLGLIHRAVFELAPQHFQRFVLSELLFFTDGPNDANDITVNCMNIAGPITGNGLAVRAGFN